MKIYRIIILLSLIGFSENLFSQESDSSKAITYSALYTTDFVGFKNSNSDLQSGMLGHIDLSMELNTESLGLWKNGTTMIYIINDHGSNPTANSVGDIQTFSNIEAPARTKLYECWYEQQMGDLSIKIGQQNVNGEFVFSETGLNLINSAFGVIPTVSSNIPISIFPNTSIGIRGIYSVTPNWNILVGVFDGEPGDETNDPYGYNWEISKNEGAIMLVESQNSIIDKTTDEIKATIKLGYWHSSSEFEDIVSGDKEKGNFGLYTIDDFVISRNVQNPDLGWRFYSRWMVAKYY